MQKQVFSTVVGILGRGGDPMITITTAARDRDGDEVVPEGAELTAYLRNPVVLFGHDYRSLPVGTTTGLDVVPGVGIRASWRWLDDDAFAARVRNAWDKGALRAASIGFIPVASEPNGRGGRKFTKWEFIEWSLVAVPANAEAVRTLKSLGLCGGDEPILELVDDDTPMVEVIDWTLADSRALRARMAQVDPLADPAARHAVDVSASEVRAVLRCAVRDAVAEMVRGQVAAAVARMTGRVD